LKIFYIDYLVKMNFEINSFYENAVAALWWNICMKMWIFFFWRAT